MSFLILLNDLRQKYLSNNETKSNFNLDQRCKYYYYRDQRNTRQYFYFITIIQVKKKYLKLKIDNKYQKQIRDDIKQLHGSMSEKEFEKKLKECEINWPKRFKVYFFSSVD
jgi:hypothetical protein